MGSHRVGVVVLANLTYRWVMGTIMLHQGGVLGLIALGLHWVMSTPRVECVITGTLRVFGTPLGFSVGS